MGFTDGIIYKIISIIDHLDYKKNKKKLVESYSLNNIDILTDTGFKPLSYTHLTKPFQIYNLVLEGGYHLTCADTHIVFDTKFNEIYLDGDELVLGDMVLSLERAKEQSIEYNHSFNREVCYLVVHSILHLLGYDHMEDEEKKRMRKREEEILGSLNITR